jgi:hypothetical protein
MAVKKKSLKDITGTPKSVAVVLVDNNVRNVVIVTDHGTFDVCCANAYSSSLEISGDEPPKLKDFWFVNCRYKDGGTSSRSFDNKDDADMEFNDRRKDRDFTVGEVTMKAMKVDEDDKVINDDIPF